MKSLTDVLLWAVGLLAFVFALWQLMQFLGARDERGIQDLWSGVDHMWMAVGGAVVAFACVAIAFARRPHVQEEIHITER